MQSLRVSCTDVDALRYYLAAEEADMGALLSQLRRETPPSPAMLAGTAFHAALERIDEGDHETLSAGGYTFTIKADGEVALPEIREVKATRDYEINGCTITLVGKVDAIHGRRVYDHKLTGRYDAERFLGSFQWRAYLEIFDADEFVWNVFEGKEAAPQQFTITSIHRLTACRYPGIGRDVERDLARFLDFVRGFLPERIAA